jgi:hypothetical protein
MPIISCMVRWESFPMAKQTVGKLFCKLPMERFRKNRCQNWRTSFDTLFYFDEFPRVGVFRQSERLRVLSDQLASLTPKGLTARKAFSSNDSALASKVSPLPMMVVK